MEIRKMKITGGSGESDKNNLQTGIEKESKNNQA